MSLSQDDFYLNHLHFRRSTISVAPWIVDDLSAIENKFQLIEKRIKWGIILGIGLFSQFQIDYNSTSIVIIGLVLWINIGILFARIAGISTEDITNKWQWLWVIVELLVAVVALYFWS